MNDPADGGPFAFRQAVAALMEARPRPEVSVSQVPAPRRLAPFAFAAEAAVAVDEEELADGRFVLLHDPAGHEGWDGDFRVVTLARADLEPELGADPLLPDVAWSWLTEALDSRGLTHRAPSGTVTRSGSHFFGALADRPPKAEIELRASWTPAGAGEVAGHLLAWCGLLAQCAGLPPESSSPAITVFPRRRGPRPA
ncbi:DUF3000 domain-containing protein [Streptomyces sodiiphilus]